MSSAVENTWLRFAGILVLRSISFVITPPSVSTQGQGSDVEQQHVLHVTLQHAGLNGGPDGHDLVGVDALMRLAPEQGRDGLLHLGHAGLAANQHDFIDLTRLQTGVLQGSPAWWNGFLDEVVDDRLQLGSRQPDVEVLGSVLVRGDEREI
ncbi:hypothetical protein ACVWXL_005149 [Bradyrhizobium sp. GM22.5]